MYSGVLLWICHIIYICLYASHALIYLITFSNTIITDFCIVSRVSCVNHATIR